MTPHKHANIIIAWADGAEIEILIPSTVEDGWEVVKNPYWHEFEVYRVKPKRQLNLVTWHAVHPKKISESFSNREDAAAPRWLTARAILRIEIDYNDSTSPMLVSATLEKT